MGKRSTGRRLAMQALYQAEVGGDSISSFFKNLSERNLLAETKTFAERLSEGAWQNRRMADEAIKKHSKSWKLSRIDEVDKSILRLAIYEMTLSVETPPAVIINEAVELSKKYCSRDAAKFVNGILGAFLKEQGVS